MENEPNFVPAEPQSSNPAPAPKANFLPMAIVAVALAGIPIASIVAIVLGSKNRKRIQNYFAEGGTRTANVKVSSILSNVGLWLGVGMTCFWALYFIIIIAATSL